MRLEITIICSNGEHEMVQGTTGTLRGILSDGTRFEAPLTLTDNVGTIVLGDGVTGKMGWHEMEVLLESDTGELHSSSFLVGVEGNPEYV